ncbi:hypothetical protein OSTOST_03074 [Ostertagia ostertagi]
MCFLAAYTCFSKLRVKLTRRAQPTKFIALLFIICIAHLAQSCQDVDVFELRATTCIRSGDGNRTCAVDITQMLKMNTFHRETCFRLLTRDTLLKEIRLEWKRLQLICDRQTVMFTRHVIQQVIDSKRCPRTGSCKGRKCASVNTTSLVPELSQGNKFPGITHCVESCGGIGCGCFYPSSGCLFYRIYATPVNDNIYEIFRCLRWKEEVVLGISITEAKGETTENTIILQPTIPQNVGTMRITLSSVTVTPTPALQTWFITEEKFWKLWKEQYLTSLREQHVRFLPGNRGSPKQPVPGQVVLIADPNMPRNSWKMGRILNVRSNAEGVVREADLFMPNRRIIRRPINQLVPLELMDTPSQPSEDTMTEPSAPAAEEPEPEIQEEEQRYNLRKRPRVNYEQLHHGMISKTLFLLAFVTLLAPALSKPLGTSTKAGINTTADSIRCTTEGLFVTSNTLSLYELCVEGYCITRENPPPTETIHLSPEITLHPYAVKWKISKGQQLDTREIECPAIPFCSQVNCWFCTANILNPECHPQTAIITIAVVLYGIVALIYTICYVPVVVGLPIRVLLVITQRIFSMCFLAAYTCFSKLRVKLTRRAQPTKFIALLFIICIAHLAQSCQDVDVFELRATTCIRSGDGNRTCAVDITQMLKMNTFHRETCFRLLTRDTLLKEIRLEWKRLQLICDRQTVMFTRHVIQQNVGTMRITLSSVTVTPTPALQTWFITEGNNTARWTGSNIPTLECPSKKAAKVLDCEIHTNCRCQPAEDKMNCICTDTNITKDFNSELRNRLPLRYPWIEFEEYHPKEELNTVKAIPTRLSTAELSTAELLVTIKEDYDSTVKEVTDTVCSVGDTTITGCYQCPHGALSEIVCFSQGESTMASVHCGENTFTVSCNNTGITSLLRFQLYQAQIHFQCEVYCGSTKTQFEITGLLHWTKTAYATGEKLLAGETSLYEEWALPDAEHIFSVLISWYKSILIVTIVLLLCIAVGYLFVWSCGTKTLQFAGYLVCISIRNTIRFGITLFIKTICCFNAVKESNQHLRKEL